MFEFLDVFRSRFVIIKLEKKTGRVITHEFANPFVGNPSKVKNQSLQEFVAESPLYASSACLAAKSCGFQVEVMI